MLYRTVSELSQLYYSNFGHFAFLIAYGGLGTTYPFIFGSLQSA